MSRPNKNIVGVRLEPKGDGYDHMIQWHIVAITGNGYDTACGLDANDPAIDHYGTVEPPAGTKIDCQECASMWRGFRALTLREINFGENS